VRRYSFVKGGGVVGEEVRARMPFFGREASMAPARVAEALGEFEGFLAVEGGGDGLPARVAEMIAGGLTVAVAAGRAEVGPRALGARSILADPRSESTLPLLNGEIKGREMFRPLAPAVLEEEVGAWFEGGEGVLSPFMSLTMQVREEKRGLVPAVTHVDGSARLQTVGKG
jgi:carbamoyltransferase